MQETLARLVEFPTVTSDREANNAALDYVGSYLQERGMYLQMFEHEGYRSLVATTQPDTKTPVAMLVGHVDVVPPNDERLSEQLFQLREEDGKLYGRGVYDMKFGIAAYMQLVDDLKNRDELDRYDFGIMITTDEEVGGENGVAKLVEAGYLPKVCILPDGGEDWQLETFAKGVANLTVQTAGESAHSSRPWEGDNALDKLDALKRAIKWRCAVSRHFRRQGPKTDTCTVTRTDAGGDGNVIPETAEADIDIRFMKQASYDKLKSSLDRLVKKYDGHWTREIIGSPCINDLTNPYLQTFARVVESQLGVSCRGFMSRGATDGRYFSKAGVPCIITEPPGGERHNDNEWIEREGFFQYKDVLLEYLGNVALKPDLTESS